MSITITRATTLNIIDCYKCGYPIALTEDHERRLREGGDSFYCPAGHGQVFKRTEVMRLREQLDAANARATTQEARALEAERAARAAKKKITTMNKRAAAGVCPCCNRTFQQLARHMKAKHPEHGGAA